MADPKTENTSSSGGNSGKGSRTPSSASLQRAAADFLRSKPAWVLKFYVALKRFGIVASFVGVWCLALFFEEVLPESLVFGVTNLIAIALFILSLPVSAFKRADLVLESVYSYSGGSKILGLGILLVFVFVNFMLVAGCKVLLDKLRGR